MTDLVVIVGRGCAVRRARLVRLQSSQGSAAEIAGDLKQVSVAGVLRSGDLVAIWMPDEEHEAFREVVRSRFVAKRDMERYRHQLVKVLVRWGPRPPVSVSYRERCSREQDWDQAQTHAGSQFKGPVQGTWPRRQHRP